MKIKEAVNAIKIFAYARNSRFKIIAFLWRPYKLQLAIIFAILFGEAVFEAVSIVFLYAVLNQAISFVSLQNQLGQFTVFLRFIANLFFIKDLFILSCILLLVAYVGKISLIFLDRYFSNYLRYKIGADLIDRIFHKFMEADYGFFLSHKQGWFLYRTLTLPSETASFLDYIPKIAVSLLRIIAVVGTILVISWQVTMAIMLLGVIYYFVTKKIATQVSEKVGKSRTVESQLQQELAAEAFVGIRQIKVFNAGKSWLKIFVDSLDKLIAICKKDSFWMVMPPVVMELFMMVFAITFLIFAKLYFGANFGTILPMFAIVFYSFQKIIPLFNNLGEYRMGISRLLPVLEIVYDTLSADIKEKDGRAVLSGFGRGIEFKEVTFTYPGRKLLFKDLSFSIERSKVTAIVGPSGAGKSTIVDLIVRLFRVQEGIIAISGIPLNDLAINTWLSQIGFVSQDTFIFHGTVKDNVKLGLAAATDDQVIQAAKDANAHDFIMGMPQGYETIVGDRGMKLSGGQRQRIAIARAIIRNPEVLILDEATSSLDYLSEITIQKTINRISSNRTVIIIAHRLSTVANADKIIVLNEGQVVEEGTHQELLEKEGAYWDLYNSQVHAKKEVLVNE